MSCQDQVNYVRDFDVTSPLFGLNRDFIERARAQEMIRRMKARVQA